MRPSRSFYANLLSEEFSNVAGVDEYLSEKKLMGGSRGSHTDYSSGVSYRNGNVETLGVGWGRMGFNMSTLSGLGRGMGMFQYAQDITKLFTSWGALHSAADAVPSMDKVYRAADFVSPSTSSAIDSGTGVGFAGLISQIGLNNWQIVADGVSFKRTRYGSGYEIYATVYVPDAPVITDEASAGDLDHYYAWCVTLVDPYGNESSPSALVASTDLSSNEVTLTATVTNGVSTGTGGFTKARLYRTLQNASAAVAATDNPVFYFVDEQTLTASGSDMVATFTDNNTDDVLTDPNNYTMSNVIYTNGVLTTLPTTYAPKFIGFAFGVPIGANWTDSATGATFKRRIYWGFNSDNSQESPGNTSTWSTENFEDLGDDPSEEIIGISGGLQGLFFVFLRNSTYVMQATGNSLLPYSFTQISKEYGLYHHSIVDCGSFVIGRSPKGFFRFNGAAYIPISENIPRTVARCIYPEGDSGAYDPVTQRYIVLVCDSGIIGSYLYSAQGTGSHTATYTKNIVTAPRNKMLVYNVRESTWEDHGNTGLQFVKTLLDSTGNSKVFAQGMSSDLHFITPEGPIYGSSFTEKTTVSTAGNAFNLDNTLDASALVGRYLFVPYLTSDGLYFSDFQSVITSVNSGNHAIANTDNFLTSVPSGGASVMVCVANNAGTITKTSNTTIEDTGNIQTTLGFKYYGIANFNPSTLALENQGFLNNSVYLTTGADDKNMVLNDAATSNQYSVTKGQLYSIAPYRFYSFETGAFYRFPMWVDYMLPPVGYLQPHDVYSKTFQTLELYVRGWGELLIEFFLDGSWNPLLANPTPDASKVITLAASDNLARIQVDLPNLVGKMLRVRLRCVRGRTSYTLNQARVTYRLMEAFGGK